VGHGGQGLPEEHEDYDEIPEMLDAALDDLMDDVLEILEVELPPEGHLPETDGAQGGEEDRNSGEERDEILRDEEEHVHSVEGCVAASSVNIDGYVFNALESFNTVVGRV